MPTHDNPTARQPWEQRDDESVQAFRAFTFYRDLGLERSLTKAYRKSLGDEASDKAANGTWDKWSSENDWPERCRAFDAHMDAIAVAARAAAREREARDLEERRWKFERENQGLLENWVRNLDEKIWESLQEGFTEKFEKFGSDGTVVEREIKVKFPALGALARAIEARNDTARQAVEGPRKRPDLMPTPSATGPLVEEVDKANTPSANEFVWVAPPPPEEPPTEEKPTKGV